MTRRCPVPVSLHNLEAKMRRGRSLDRPRPPQLDPRPAAVLEETDAFTKEHGDQMNLQLVHQPCPQVLPNDVHAAPDPDVSLAGGGLALLEAGLDSAGDEGVGGAALHRHRLTRLVREHEYRPLEGRRISPRLHADVEHALPHQDRSRPRVHLIEHLRVRVCLSGEHPIVEASVVVSKWFLDALVGPGDETVHRHRNIEMDLGHRCSFVSGRHTVDWPIDLAMREVPCAARPRLRRSYACSGGESHLALGRAHPAGQTLGETWQTIVEYGLPGCCVVGELVCARPDARIGVKRSHSNAESLRLLWVGRVELATAFSAEELLPAVRRPPRT